MPAAHGNGEPVAWATHVSAARCGRNGDVIAIAVANKMPSLDNLGNTLILGPRLGAKPTMGVDSIDI